MEENDFENERTRRSKSPPSPEIRRAASGAKGGKCSFEDELKRQGQKVDKTYKALRLTGSSDLEIAEPFAYYKGVAPPYQARDWYSQETICLGSHIRSRP